MSHCLCFPWVCESHGIWRSPQMTSRRCRHPAHSSSLPALLVASLPLAPAAARQHTAQVAATDLSVQLRIPGTISARPSSCVSVALVTCTQCNVNSRDRHCTNHPRSCYECCTTSGTIHTCPPHFQQLGRTAAETQLLTGLLDPNILADAADDNGRADEVKADDVNDDGRAPSSPYMPIPGGPSSVSPSTEASLSSSAPSPPGAAAGQSVTLESLADAVARMTALVQQMAQAQATSAAASAAAIGSASSAPPTRAALQPPSFALSLYRPLPPLHPRRLYLVRSILLKRRWPCS